ncbi:hypothetical protein ACFE04_001901 [Oxalis oulophora]
MNPYLISYESKEEKLPATHRVHSPSSKSKPLRNRNFHLKSCLVSNSRLPLSFKTSLSIPNLSISTSKQYFTRTACISSSSSSSSSNSRSSEEEIVETETENVGVVFEEKTSEATTLVDQSIWNQMKEIVSFTGPATGLWICGPLMSLIDTADRNEVQHQITVLLSVALTCGFFMLLFTKFYGSWALTAFTGAKNPDIIPAANTYVQIRGLAWPAVLVGWVTQSASLGMKDSWGPLKALAVASAINGIGDVVLCMFLGYGIAGAAWATMISQVVAAFLMIDSLRVKGYDAFSVKIPSPNDLRTIVELAAPVFVVMMSKVAFYSLIIYFATSMGTYIGAAHQVMVQTFLMCSVWGEPLSQTAQSFMPEFLCGVNRSLEKARMMLKSLVIIGSILGLTLGTVGTLVPWLFPNLFTSDPNMHKVLVPYFLALTITPCIVCFEGTLLAGRDLKFISLSMSGCFSVGALALLPVVMDKSVQQRLEVILKLLQEVIEANKAREARYEECIRILSSIKLKISVGEQNRYFCEKEEEEEKPKILLQSLVSSRGYGLAGCWYTLLAFQTRLLSPRGILFCEESGMEKLKAA